MIETGNTMPKMNSQNFRRASPTFSYGGFPLGDKSKYSANIQTNLQIVYTGFEKVSLVVTFSTVEPPCATTFQKRPTIQNTKTSPVKDLQWESLVNNHLL